MMSTSFWRLKQKQPNTNKTKEMDEGEMEKDGDGVPWNREIFSHPPTQSPRHAFVNARALNYKSFGEDSGSHGN